MTTANNNSDSKAGRTSTEIVAAIANELEKRKVAEKNEIKIEESFEKYIMSIIAHAGKWPMPKGLSHWSF